MAGQGYAVLREKVAEAIVKSAIASGQKGIPNWEHAHLYERHGRTFRDVALMEADAALAAVKAALAEPDEAMCVAAVTRDTGWYTRSATADFLAAWRRAIAASPLSEAPDAP